MANCPSPSGHGGDGGNRTRVQRVEPRTGYKLVRRFGLVVSGPLPAGSLATSRSDEVRLGRSLSASGPLHPNCLTPDPGRLGVNQGGVAA